MFYHMVMVRLKIVMVMVRLRVVMVIGLGLGSQLSLSISYGVLGLKTLKTSGEKCLSLFEAQSYLKISVSKVF